MRSVAEKRRKTGDISKGWQACHAEIVVFPGNQAVKKYIYVVCHEAWTRRFAHSGMRLPNANVEDTDPVVQVGIHATYATSDIERLSSLRSRSLGVGHG